MLGHWLRKWCLARYQRQCNNSISIDNYKVILAYSETMLPEQVSAKFNWIDAVRHTISVYRNAHQVIEDMDRCTLAISNKAASLRFIDHPPQQAITVDAFLTTHEQTVLAPNDTLTQLTTKLQAMLTAIEQAQVSKGQRSAYCRSVHPLVMDVARYATYLHTHAY